MNKNLIFVGIIATMIVLLSAFVVADQTVSAGPDDIEPMPGELPAPEVPTTPAVIQYTITVESSNDDFGTVTGSGTYNSGQTITITAEAKNGYAFAGWSDNKDAGAERNVTVTSDKTYTAEFVEAVKISYNVNNVDVLIVPSDVYVVPNSTVEVASLSDPVGSTLKFICWTTTPDKSYGEMEYVSDSFTIGEEDVTLYAVWLEEGYYILDVIQSQGGRICNSSVVDTIPGFINYPALLSGKYSEFGYTSSEGRSISFSCVAVPDHNYKASCIVIDGAEINETEYSFSFSTGYHTLSAVFKESLGTVTVINPQTGKLIQTTTTIEGTITKVVTETTGVDGKEMAIVAITDSETGIETVMNEGLATFIPLTEEDGRVVIDNDVANNVLRQVSDLEIGSVDCTVDIISKNANVSGSSTFDFTAEAFSTISGIYNEMTLGNDNVQASLNRPILEDLSDAHTEVTIANDVDYPAGSGMDRSSLVSVLLNSDGKAVTNVEGKIGISIRAEGLVDVSSVSIMNIIPAIAQYIGNSEQLYAAELRTVDGVDHIYFETDQFGDYVISYDILDESGNDTTMYIVAGAVVVIALAAVAGYWFLIRPKTV